MIVKFRRTDHPGFLLAASISSGRFQYFVLGCLYRIHAPFLRSKLKGRFQFHRNENTAVLHDKHGLDVPPPQQGQSPLRSEEKNGGSRMCFDCF